jgi:hypothetical protein
MKFFRLWLRGNTDDKSLAFVRDLPSGLGLYDNCMRSGERIGDHYPANLKVRLDKRSPGIKLQALLGNTLSYLMLNTEAKDVILGVCKCEIEVLPFVLYNHKNRIHSKDYWILNPIGTIDCVNRAASNIQYSKDDGTKIIGVGLTPGSLVFDPKKLAKAPDLFRVPEEPARMFISQTLAQAIKARNLNASNILLVEEMQQKAVA